MLLASDFKPLHKYQMLLTEQAIVRLDDLLDSELQTLESFVYRFEHEDGGYVWEVPNVPACNPFCRPELPSILWALKRAVKPENRLALAQCANRLLGLECMMRGDSPASWKGLSMVLKSASGRLALDSLSFEDRVVFQTTVEGVCEKRYRALADMLGENHAQFMQPMPTSYVGWERIGFLW